MLCFFFFKQKTAYEMRISDWSSDVCSSDLIAVIEGRSVAVDLAPSGYGFARRVDGAWQPLPGRAFERRGWPSDVRVAAGGGQGVARILFDRVGTSTTPQAEIGRAHV